MKWTEQDIPDLTGKTIVVTGANSGIGYEATRLFAKKQAEVIMACRSIERAEAAFDKIKNEFPTAKLVIMSLDLASFSSIHTFSEQLHSKYTTIDVLLNNAGIMMTPYQETVDGLEQQQGINHFGHFLLTNVLFDMLQQSDDPRIVNISSIAHRFGKLNFNNMQFKNKKGYVPSLAYGRSKLENLLFTYALARRVKQANLPIKVLAAHPGISSTNLGNHIYERGVYKVFHALTNKFTQSAYQGSLPGVRAAVDADAQNGTFYGPDKLFGVKGNPVVCTSTKRSKKESLQEQLWTYSEQVTNKPFTI